MELQCAGVTGVVSIAIRMIENKIYEYDELVSDYQKETNEIEKSKKWTKIRQDITDHPYRHALILSLKSTTDIVFTASIIKSLQPIISQMTVNIIQSFNGTHIYENNVFVLIKVFVCIQNVKILYLNF